MFSSAISEQNIYKAIDSRYINDIEIKRSYSDDMLSEVNIDIFFNTNFYVDKHRLEGDIMRFVQVLNQRYSSTEIYINAWCPMNITLKEDMGRHYDIEEIQKIKEDIKTYVYDIIIVDHVFENNIIVYYKNEIYSNISDENEEERIITIPMVDVYSRLKEIIQKYFGEIERSIS
jgi:hypothetical protein